MASLRSGILNACRMATTSRVNPSASRPPCLYPDDIDTDAVSVRSSLCKPWRPMVLEDTCLYVGIQEPTTMRAVCAAVVTQESDGY